uniref:Candidate secreted effector n=1 Tax=Meloidogyne incognita TaxID=6306 RepID=A0A914LEN4_MELIC
MGKKGLSWTTLMTSTNASLPKVSYVKSLDIFLGVVFLFVRIFDLSFITSLVYSYSLLFELEDGTLRKMDQVIIPPSPPTQIQTDNKNINGHSKRFRNSCRKYSTAPANVSALYLQLNGNSNDNY